MSESGRRMPQPAPGCCSRKPGAGSFLPLARKTGFPTGVDGCHTLTIRGRENCQWLPSAAIRTWHSVKVADNCAWTMEHGAARHKKCEYMRLYSACLVLIGIVMLPSGCCFGSSRRTGAGSVDVRDLWVFVESDSDLEDALTGSTWDVLHLVYASELADSDVVNLKEKLWRAGCTVYQNGYVTGVSPRDAHYGYRTSQVMRATKEVMESNDLTRIWAASKALWVNGVPFCCMHTSMVYTLVVPGRLLEASKLLLAKDNAVMLDK